MRSFQGRKAFTLVELLVVIAIIGVMVGLLLPAVQAAREAARRMSCSNNMKQLGLGLHNYHSTFNRFPYSVGLSGSITVGTAIPGAGRARNQRGWLAILPFIEQQSLYDLADLKLATGAYVVAPNTVGGPLPGAVGNPNDVVVSTPVETFLCPSDPNETNYNTAGSTNYSIAVGSTTRLGAHTNYDFSSPRISSTDTNWGQRTGNRHMFGMNDNSRIRDLIDGTSNTVAVCETIRGTAHNGVSPAWGYSRWVGNGIDLTYAAGINDTFHPVNVNTRSRLREWGTAGSLHPGGAQFVLGDASVRFISESTDLVTLQRLSWIADGQVLGEF